MHIKSTTRARSPFVALVVLALLFMGISAIAYPTLSSDSENGNDTDPTDGERYSDPASRDGWSASADEDGNEAITIRGIGGFVFTPDREPAQGATITLREIERSPLPPERPDPVADPDDGRPERPDRPDGDGVRGETDGNTNIDRKETNHKTDEDRKDPDGRKNSDAPVRESDVLKTTTDRTGGFEFLGLERGIYHLQVFVGNRMVFEDRITYSGQGSSPMRIVLRDRTDDENYVVKGIVVNEKGEPVPGAHVELIRNEPIERPPVDLPGNDRDPYVRPGDPERPLHHEDDQVRTDGIRDREDNEPPKDENDQEEQPEDNTDPYERPERSERSDRDDDDWKHLEPGLMPPIRPARSTTTDRDGTFGFRDVSPGTYTLIVRAKGYEPAKQRLVVRDDTRTKVLLDHLRQNDHKLFKLHATVVDGDGDGHPDDVMITASGKDGKPLGGVMIYIDGEYVGATSYQGWLLDLDHEPGIHRVIGEYNNHRAITKFIVPGECPEEPPHPEFGVLKGQVFSDDEPVPYAIIEIMNDDFHREARAGKEGEFVFERIPAGEYRVMVFAGGYVPHDGEVFIEPNEIREIEIILDAGIIPETGSIGGIVLNEENEPILDGVGHVTAFHEFLDIAFRARILEDGTFFLEDLPAGEYTLRIFMEGYQGASMTAEVFPGEPTEITVLLVHDGE